jgi:DNA mismatch repair ATPase MutS
MSIMSIGTYIVSMNQTLNQLYYRVVDVATCFNAIKNINNLIEKSPAIAHNNYTVMEYDDRIKEFLNKLAAPRFSQKKSYLYSRGNVLSMHKEIKDIKRSLVPLLQSVAFLDAFCSIAQLYKESQEQPVKFSFPEFVPSQKPFFSYTDVWLPLLPYNEAVTNDLCLGRDSGCPGKIVIVGPNGGGKSTLLKTYGIAVVLAQSWLIIPALHGSQTLFAQIKTALDTREDAENKLSLGMAVMKKMNELFVAMQKSDGQKKKMLVLIDEPYKGFVDDEAADRIYEFGKNITEFSNVLLAMATHTKKPIMLEVDTNGIFGNYHVKIDELSFGVFKRLFKIEKGPSMWWFEDSSKRRRFTDWLNTELVVSD